MQVLPSVPALTRRDFVKTLLAGTAGLGAPRAFGAPASGAGAFSFLLLGDLHFDKLQHHDLEALQKEKPDDFRQVHDYSRIASEIMPRLFGTLRERINRPSASERKVDFVVQVGDLVEGLCGSRERAARQDAEALDFVRSAQLGVPFVFTKGNHDVTGQGAVDAFREVFNPFISQQAKALDPAAQAAGARYCVQHGPAMFCFFDAYDKESLPWLEAELAKRTVPHCLLVLHPPVVPYGARSTWHIFSAERQRAERERLLELLGRHNAVVLSGHIHKYNFLERATPRGGKFVQLAISSVLPALEVEARNLLSGVGDYNPAQIKVEPQFSPATEAQRRAVYEAEAPFVKQFQYADLPGYAVVTVDKSQVNAQIYAGSSHRLWRTVALTAGL